MDNMRGPCLTGGWLVLAIVAALSLSLPAQAQDVSTDVDLSQLTGTVIVDGSSTVWPILTEAAERFTESAPTRIDVEISGTGGGFDRFCAGESDVQNASRPITDDELADCEATGVEFAVFPLGYDGITVVVHPENTWAECLSVEQLRSIWEPDNPERTWQEVDSTWPATEVELYGPDVDSGTFDYFTEVIMGEVGLVRTDHSASDNDFFLVESVASQPNALGYFGYAYFAENAEILRAVAIDSGEGCTAPTLETIADGSYAPLSRPLFVYVKLDSLSRPEVREFIRFAIDQSEDIVTTVGYVPLTTDEYNANRDQFETILKQISGPDA